MDTKLLKKSCFTLIEMLVVVVIIIILASMLLPALEHARNAGYKVACASNLKQLQTAHNLYTLDNDKHFVDPHNSDPYAWAQNAASESAITNGTLYKYTGNTELYYCEADETHLYRSYSVSNAVGGDANRGDVTAAQKRNHVTEAFSEVYTFIEESDPRSATNNGSFYTRAGSYALWQGGDWPAAYHISGYNLAFLDGHVKHVNMTRESVDLSLSGNPGVGLTISADNPDRKQLFEWQNVK
jgi:prepilin-type processing-associated H-X9-DG protein